VGPSSLGRPPAYMTTDVEVANIRLQYQRAMTSVAYQNDLDSVITFMKWGLSPSISFDSVSLPPLYVAVQQEQYDMVDAICAHKRDHALENEDFGPLMLWPASSGNLRMVQFLFDHGFRYY